MQNNLPSWVRLLSFAKKCLQTPIRGSKRWNLANLMKKQVNQDLPTIEGHTTGPPEQSKPTKKHNQMEQLALRVSSKLEEGNCRGAVRLACIEDAITARPCEPSRLSIHHHYLTPTSLPWIIHHHLLSPLILRSSREQSLLSPRDRAGAAMAYCLNIPKIL